MFVKRTSCCSRPWLILLLLRDEKLANFWETRKYQEEPRTAAAAAVMSQEVMEGKLAFSSYSIIRYSLLYYNMYGKEKVIFIISNLDH